MDFVTVFPKKSDGNYAILIIIDGLTKQAHFLPARMPYKMEQYASLYIRDRLHGTLFR